MQAIWDYEVWSEADCDLPLLGCTTCNLCCHVCRSPSCHSHPTLSTWPRTLQSSQFWRFPRVSPGLPSPPCWNIGDREIWVEQWDTNLMILRAMLLYTSCSIAETDRISKVMTTGTLNILQPIGLWRAKFWVTNGYHEKIMNCQTTQWRLMR